MTPPVTRAARCPFCRYPREGLGESDACPECGGRPSDVVPALTDEPPRRRRRIARGARLGLAVMAVRVAHAAALLIAVIAARPLLSSVLVTGLLIAAVLNAAAGFQLTSRTLPMRRAWVGTTLRAVLIADLFIAAGACVAAFTPAYVALETAAVITLAATWLARSALTLAMLDVLADRLRSARLRSQLRGLIKYTGIAAMTPIVAVIAGALTALIPILAPFTVIAAVPYLVFVGVLIAIAVIAAVLLQARLAEELRIAAQGPSA